MELTAKLKPIQCEPYEFTSKNTGKLYSGVNLMVIIDDRFNPVVKLDIAPELVEKLQLSDQINRNKLLNRDFTAKLKAQFYKGQARLTVVELGQ